MVAPSNWRALVTESGAAYQDIVLPNDAPFDLVLIISGFDYTAAAFAGDVRNAPDLGSAIVKSFTFGTATLVGGDTHITASLAEADVEALGDAGERGGAIEQYYRIQITPSGGAKALWLAGKFTRLGS